LSISGIGASILVWPALMSFFNSSCRFVCSEVGTRRNGSGLGLFPSITDSFKLLKKAYSP